MIEFRGSKFTLHLKMPGHDAHRPLLLMHPEESSECESLQGLCLAIVHPPHSWKVVDTQTLAVGLLGSVSMSLSANCVNITGEINFMLNHN